MAGAISVAGYINLYVSMAGDNILLPKYKRQHLTTSKVQYEQRLYVSSQGLTVAFLR
jgi:hypothetical protein